MMMKAMEYLEYGAPEVLHMNEVKKPFPKRDEVLIKVHAATVTAADLMMRSGEPVVGRVYLGLRGPKRTILGFDFAGEVEQIGEDVTLFKMGDKVFGGTTTLGCYAEFVCVNEKNVIATMPQNITYEEAAPVSSSAITVMNFLVGMGKIQTGQKVLINGASGGLGTYAVQIAKLFGGEVIGICGPGNVAMVKSLGADRVIDYSKEDFTKNGEKYDIIFDTVGKRSFSECKNSLTSNGVYLSSVMNGGLFRQMLWTSLFGGKKAKSGATGMLPVKMRLKYLNELKELLSTAKIKSVLDTVYPMKFVADAHRYVELGHKKGNVVISI